MRNEDDKAATMLSVQDLQVCFHTRDGTVFAVDGVSFRVNRGETLCIVGESGCGKSVTAMSILRLLPHPPAAIDQGAILFDGRDLLQASDSDMREIRGNAISMIFQEPMTSLNPVLTVGRQIAESIALHQQVSDREALARAVDILDKVKVSDPKRRAGEYPHQLSGGMRQRVMIAMALSCNPQLLIADEPTTALDVTIQAQILDLMRGLQKDFGTAIVLITHDLGVVAEMADRVVVMYAGRKVEEADVATLFADPQHPYTKGLIHSMPRLNQTVPAGEQRTRLQEIPGMVPQLKRRIEGCAFAPRCAQRFSRCDSEVPTLLPAEGAHRTACWLADQSQDAAGRSNG